MKRQATNQPPRAPMQVKVTDLNSMV